jgi:small subunit ribosomal protein S7
MKLYKNIEQSFFNRLVGVLAKKGSTFKAKKVVVKVFTQLKNELNKPLNLLLIQAWRRLDVFVECRKVRVRRKFINVPFLVSNRRRVSLALKWIVNTALSNKKKISFTKKLYHEFLVLNTKEESEAFKLKNLNNETAKANRANMHYRW